MKRVIINEMGERMVTMDREDRGPLTEEEMEMIRQAGKIPYIYDEDCPPMPDDMIAAMRQDAAERKAECPASSHRRRVRSVRV